MKNLKKVLALVVVFAMMLSTVAFAGSFPDVADDADYAGAVETLSAMGFFKGDENGNFNPDATITRAEYAVIVCRILGIEGSATGKCDFTDAADHWATGYIKMANQYGIVKGYGDGNFGPDDAVKYEEAVKMLVCALGYEPMATSKGGYPTGYIAVASQIGLLDGVAGTAQGTGAARSVVAMMTYNALDIPVMEQIGFGTEISYDIMKKNDDHDKSTLLTKMGIYKLGGTVKANSKVSYEAGVDKVDAGKIYFEVEDDYDCPEKALALKTAISGGLVVATNNKFTFDVGTTNAEDFVATKSIVYVAKVAGKWTVQAIELDTDSTGTLVIKASQLNDDELAFNATAPSARYYKEGVTSGDGTKINLDAAYVPAWNNTTITAAQLASNLNSSVAAEIEFIDTDNDNKYDIVKVSNYVHVIVDEVKASKGIVETLEGVRVDFDIENDDAIVNIVDVNGNALEISDIAEGDVLALLIGMKGAAFLPNTSAVKNANYDSLDVVVLKNSTVTGAVKEYDPTYDASSNLEELTISVDGADYDVAVNDAGMYNLSKIDLQAEGTFYVGIYGDIIGFEGDKLTSDNFGLILNAYVSSNPSVAPEVTMITKEGNEVTYDLASSVRFVNPNTGKYEKINIKDNATSSLVNSLDKTTWKNVLNTSSAVKTAIGTAFAAELDTITTTKNAEAVKRFITYKLNSNNEIVEITPASTEKVTTENVDFGLLSTTADAKTYNANGQKLGSYLLADDAVVFEIDWDNASATKVTDVSYFVDDSEYTVLMYNKDEDGYYGAAVVIASDAVFEEGAGLAIVESKRTISADDKEVVKVVAYQDGEQIELIFDDDEYTEVTSNVNPENFDIGTVFMYNADAEGYVSKYSVVGTTTVGASKTFAFNSNFKADFAADAEDGDAFYYGYITEKTKNDATLSVNVTAAVQDDTSFNGANVQFTVKNANQYTVTGTRKNPTITVGTYTDGDVDVKDGNNGYYVLIRTFEDEVIDIIAFDGNAVDVSSATTIAPAPTAVVEPEEVVEPAEVEDEVPAIVEEEVAVVLPEEDL